MCNIKFVQPGLRFAQFSKSKKLASNQNLKSLTQKTKNQGNYQVSRRFGKYSFYHFWPKNDGEKWSRKNIPPCA